MSFPAYDDYHETGMQSLGDIPTHWELKRLKDVASHNDDALGEDTLEDADFLYVDISGVNTQQGIHTKEEVVFKDAPSRARRRVQDGDVIVSTVRTYLKAIARVIEPEENLIVSTGFAVVRPGEQLNPSYSGFLLLSNYFIDEVISHSTGVSYPAINASDLVRIHVPVPPLDEQMAISSFLDGETSKIDGLVSEQRLLIELLKEKRQAVISHAVTKGLNPNAPMKPSGIEWLGKVPEGWEVASLKRGMQFVTSGSRGWAQYYSDDGEVFLRIGNLTRDSVDLDLSDIQRVTVPDGSEGERTQVRPGDVLFSVTAYLGSVAVVPEDLETSYVSQHVALVRLDLTKVTSRWVGFAALATSGKTWFDQQAYGGTKIQLSLDDVANLPMPFPPLEEQDEIVAHIDERLETFSQLQGEAERAIELLQERRTALISAAVTGKIDVREIAYQETV